MSFEFLTHFGIELLFQRGTRSYYKTGKNKLDQKGEDLSKNLCRSLVRFLEWEKVILKGNFKESKVKF